MSKKTAPSSTSIANRRSAVLAAILKQVPFDGWTETAYAAALTSTKVGLAEAGKLFPEGVRDCIELFGVMTDEAMETRIKAEKNFTRLRTRDKITFAIRARLEHLAPDREAMRRLMTWYALPHHMPMAVKRFYQTVDSIWLAAGDTATDYNFYSKRILLAAVLKATLLFWLGDDSVNSSATWDFLDRRIGDVMKLGKSISLLKEFKPAELVEMVREKIKKAL